MDTVYYDPPFSDERRREELYQGQLLVYSPRKSTLAFIEFAKKMIKEAFVPIDLMSRYDDETVDTGVLTYQHKAEHGA